MNRNRQEKGITLIALVVTIAILIILAGITINVAFGKNGIMKSSQEFSNKVQEAQEQKNQELSNLLEELNDTFNGTPEEEITLKPYELAETMGGANSPNISGFNVENTYYVTWGTTAPYQPNETSKINNAPPSGWSNYNEKEWANIKTTGGENDCYWVWIPRYAYKVPTRSSTAETIEIKFLKGTTNTPIDRSNIEIKNQTGSGNWNVHPAFWFDKNNNGIEDEGKQLTGIWVAKFEASSNASNVVENPSVEDLAIDGGSATDTDLKVRVKPNVTSWRGITVNNIFTVCRNLTETGNSLENTINLNSHMMKNTEWGAVAYLSRSVYGINSEVWNNPYYNNTTNFSPITGLCGNETNGKDNATTIMSNTVRYNEIGGGNASTTGNVYGIYDMAGGAWEYVAGYLSEITALTNYTTLASADPKYKDVYAGTSSDRTTNYNANTGKYGDAVYETSSSGGSLAGSWDSSSSYFPRSSLPVFLRGGPASVGGSAGVFAFNCNTGAAYTHFSFRPVVLSSHF